MKPFHCGKCMNVNGQIFSPSLDEAEAALARGEDFVVTRQSMWELAAEVKRRDQARLAAGPSATR